VRRWKRDAVLCGAGVPAKVKPNGNFDDHLHAALCRDAGSENRAAALLARMAAPAVPFVLRLSSDSAKPPAADDGADSGRPLRVFAAHFLKIDDKKKCQFAVFPDRLLLTFRGTGRTRKIHRAAVAKILLRPMLARLRAAEIYVRHGRSVLLAFDAPAAEVLQFIAGLRHWAGVCIQTQPSRQFFAGLGATDAWLAHRKSTFEYLLALNEASGRSFSDARIYPVFPWVLADYTAQALELSPAVLRDLAKPMVAIGDARLAELKAKADGRPPYLCSACYSSPLCIYIWLLRLEPFTSMHIRAQNGRFDVPSRIFTSVRLSYELATSLVGDYRELVPEFFYDNQFLMNVNKYNLGELRGEVLNDAVLPPWSHQSAIEFVYLQRKALECESVGAAICHWIDLIWGCAQNGQAAVDADNTFAPLLYESAVGCESLDEVEAWRESCGQIPQQLFATPHPRRGPAPQVRLCTKVAPLKTGLVASTLLGLFGRKLVCFCEGEIAVITVDFKKPDIPDVKQKSWKPRLVDAKRVIALSKRDVCAVLSDGCLVRAGAIDVAQLGTGMFTTLSGRSEYVCIGRNDTSIAIYRELKVVQTFPSFRHEIVCSAVSAAFDLAAVGAWDSTLFLISLSQRTITRVIPLGKCNPIGIIITRGWGFIVVHEREIESTEEFIELFTVNGDPIRKTKIGFEIDCWSSWKSRDGFDYLIIAPKSGRLRVCEVFWLVFHLLPQSANLSRAIFYCPALEIIFVNQLDGQIIMIPYHIDFA
jgi:hypothetical protein